MYSNPNTSSILLYIHEFLHDLLLLALMTFNLILTVLFKFEYYKFSLYINVPQFVNIIMKINLFNILFRCLLTVIG